MPLPPKRFRGDFFLSHVLEILAALYLVIVTSLAS